MKRLAKAASGTGGTGGTGVFDEPIGAFGVHVGEGEALSRARHVPLKLPVPPVPPTENDQQPVEKQQENGGTGRPLGPVPHRFQPVPHAEALAVHVLAWAQLPVPSSLELAHPSLGRVWFTAARSRAQDAFGRGEPCFAPSEYEAAVAGVLEGRADRHTFAAWVRTKLARPHWVLAPVEAVAGAAGLLDGSAPNLAEQRVRRSLLGSVTWARALDALGLEIVDVHAEQAAPVEAPNVEAM